MSGFLKKSISKSVPKLSRLIAARLVAEQVAYGWKPFAELAEIEVETNSEMVQVRLSVPGRRPSYHAFSNQDSNQILAFLLSVTLGWR